MKGLAEILDSLAALEAPAALATLVRTQGSSYRQPGARMIFRPGGPQTGVISAGCMETDVKARVASVLETGQPQVASFDMGSDLDLIWGTGMGCAGRADVLLEPVEPGRPPAWAGICAQLLRTRRRGVLATVHEAAPGPLARGDRFLLEEGGPGLPPPAAPWGETLRSTMEEALESGKVRSLTLPEGQVLVEPILPPLALWIFGAGEHARPLARIARELGWFLGIVDHRPALATPERFPEADRIAVGPFPDVLEGLPLDGRSAALVVSHVYEQDVLAVDALLEKPLAYLGLQGNRNRCARILDEIQEKRAPLSPCRKALLHAPAGLDLGAESPEAIALSMLAEIQAAFSGHGAGPLRDRPGSIHRSRP